MNRVWWFYTSPQQGFCPNSKIISEPKKAKVAATIETPRAKQKRSQGLRGKLRLLLCIQYLIPANVCFNLMKEWSSRAVVPMLGI